MPLVVPVLRLAMLFLNVYESYKTLKTPPPSARNEGRPSQRALTQRKRDMKGCLAVWIVWSCLMTYETFAEGLVSLFVPFYDEVKSLGLLFLILTRARGAEPIFLHLIRPSVKPYVPTIDMLLDVARMVGDITFAILAIPAESASAWWKSSMFYAEEATDSEREGMRETAVPAARSTSANLKHGVGNNQQAQEPFRIPKEATLARQLSSSSRRASGASNPRPSQTRSRVDKVGQRVQSSDNADSHQIWYLPPSSYLGEEDEGGATSTISGLPNVEVNTGFLSSEAMRGQAALDEWRQYPPFPSAYPPTPIVTSSTGLPTAGTASARAQPLANSLVLSEILEDAIQQDFSRSLLPPRKPLNPRFVDDLSDEHHILGVQSNRLDSIAVDTDSEADEEEDVFNTTLQTPMPPLRVTRSGIVPVIPMDREVSMASSAATRSTTLTTAGHRSLRTQSSSESLSSSAVSMSDLSSVLGKKRPLPLDMMDEPCHQPPISAPPSNVASRPVRQQRTSKVDHQEPDSTSSTTDDRDADSINDRKPAHPKRRKVIMTPRRPVNATRPIRPRIARYATAPTKAQIPKPPKPPSASLRGSSRQQRSITRSTGSTGPSDASASQASLSSTYEASLDTHVRVTRRKATKPSANVKEMVPRPTSDSEAT
ncbi:putative TB2/DP1, HVA22 family protein [Lyophyllum shimeji]|uniref:TB2/DP1, HVA22 family protein n=1 Tax=Lyophyllum shimeji TaxID=47721 RepID=A0A9P3PE30_LYOSH|nr:putative TB2/DP1, HVA22 family protein [Lyophyllum shimeji]